MEVELCGLDLGGRSLPTGTQVNQKKTMIRLPHTGPLMPAPRAHGVCAPEVLATPVRRSSHSAWQSSELEFRVLRVYYTRDKNVDKTVKPAGIAL